jgi:hypothetical protein
VSAAVRSLAANPSNYAWAGAANPMPYPYGTYPQASPLPSAVAAAAAAPAPATALMEMQAQSQSQMYRPYAPSLAPSDTPARDTQMDLMQSEYQTYTQQNWPSHVAPPAAYYLPPDVVAI